VSEEQQPVGPLRRLLYLKKIPTLSGLPASELVAVAERSVERFHPKGSVIMPEGEPARAVYFVMSGQLEVTRKGQPFGPVGPGEGVGGLTLFARDPHAPLVRAATDALVLEIDAETVIEVLEDRFPILHHLMRNLCRQLVELIARLRLDPLVGNATPPLPEVDRELDLVERIFYLRQMVVFENASISALAELSRAMTQVAFRPGTVLWEEGEPSGGIYVLLSGRVRATSPRGLDFRLGAGFPLGALDSVGELPRWYRAEAETPLVALQGNVQVMLDVFEDNFEMARDYLAVLAGAMIRIMESTAARGATGP
jgi:CRP-like cAMP-binding protein